MNDIPRRPVLPAQLRDKLKFIEMPSSLRNENKQRMAIQHKILTRF